MSAWMNGWMDGWLNNAAQFAGEAKQVSESREGVSYVLAKKSDLRAAICCYSW